MTQDTGGERAYTPAPIGHSAEALRTSSPMSLRSQRAIWRRIEDGIYTGKGSERTDAGAELSRLVARIEKDLR